MGITQCCHVGAFFRATLDGWQLVVDDRWRPPLVDDDWHAVCHAIHTGVEGGVGELVLQVCGT